MISLDGAWEADWAETARKHCFGSDKAMLVHWYYTWSLSLFEISERIGFGTQAIRSRFVELKLPLREEDKS